MPKNENTLSLSRQDALSLTLSRSRTHTQSKHNTYIECPANFFEYPAPEDRFPFILGSKLIKGDLHSNAINFIYFLVKQNVIDIPEGQYNRLLNIYYKLRLAVVDKDANLTDTDIIEFEKIVSDAMINVDLLAAILKDNSHLLTTLLNLSGDETSDRGLDDFLILIILKKLFDSKIPYLINASNHGLSFYRAYERKFETFAPFGLQDKEQARSLTHLGELIAGNIISKEKLIEYTEKYYKPFLVLSDHTYDEITDSLTISVHALAGPATHMELAQGFGVPSEFKNNKEWAASLDQINAEFEVWKKENVVTEHYNDPAIQKLIWNNEYKPGDTPADLPAGCQNVHFIHGHSSIDEKESEKYPNSTNLDSEHGKSDLFFIGQYKAYYEGPASLKKPDFSEKNANLVNPIDALFERIEKHKSSPSYSKFKLEKVNKIERAVAAYGVHVSVDENEDNRITEFHKELSLLITKARKDINKLRTIEENEELIHQNLEQLKKEYNIARNYLLNLVTFADGRLENYEDIWFLQMLAESQYEKYGRMLAKQKKMGDSREIEAKTAVDDSNVKLQDYLAQVDSYKEICATKFAAYQNAIFGAEREEKLVGAAKLYRLAASELTSAIDQLTTIKRILGLANNLGLESLIVSKEKILADAKLLEYKTIKSDLQSKLNSSKHIESILNEPKRVNPRKGLTDYINRIEKNKLNGEINFKHGFWIMKDSRAANRKATYELAKDLLDQLKDPDTDVKSIFNGAVARRNMFFSSKYKNREINSRTMNQVINSVIKPR